MAHQARIVLTALNGNVTPSERHITLKPGDSPVPVGRASKTAAKGLSGAEDNAWFDSPVMSRNHAQIAYNPEAKTITIEDIGSMHGTYLNDTQISSNVPKSISDNDEVKFGAEVRRGPEIFPACRFRVNYELVPYQTMNTFEVPEYSDSDGEEEEEDCDFSDTPYPPHTSSVDGSFIESPVSKASKDHDAIDLTGDDSPELHRVIDLTEDGTPAEERPVDLMAGHPADIPDCTSQANVTVDAEIPSAIVADSDNDSISSTDSEDQIEHTDIFGSDSSDSEEDEGDYSINEIDETESLETDEEDYPMDDGFSLDDDEEEALLEAADQAENIPRSAIATDVEIPFVLGESPALFNAPEAPLHGDDSDYDSDFGLSEAGAEGMRVMHNSGLLRKLPEAVSLNKSNLHEKVENDTQTGKVNSPAAFSQFQSPEFGSLGMENVNSAVRTQQNTIEEHPRELPTLIFRQPSPSDAAMVKTRPATADLGVHSNVTVTSLAEKYGKAEFFAARQENKLMFTRAEPSKTGLEPKAQDIYGMISNEVNTTNSSLIQKGTYSALPGAASSDFRTSASANPTPAKATEIAIHGISHGTVEIEQPHFDLAMPRRDACSFLDKPDTTPFSNRDPSPLPNMTSSATYVASKDAMAEAKSKANNPQRVLKIKDLCDSSSTPSVKRKSDAISDSTEQELRTWASDTSNNMLNASNVSTLSSGRSSEQVDLTLDAVEPRPMKKLKRFLEGVGYAAVGGAFLFSVLNATAPDFL